MGRKPLGGSTAFRKTDRVPIARSRVMGPARATHERYQTLMHGVNQKNWGDETDLACRSETDLPSGDANHNITAWSLFAHIRTAKKPTLRRLQSAPCVKQC